MPDLGKATYRLFLDSRDYVRGLGRVKAETKATTAEMKRSMAQSARAMEQPRDELGRFVRQTTTATNIIGQRWKETGEQISRTGRRMSTHLSLPFAAAVGISVKLASDFEQQMSSLGAVTNATAREMDGLRRQAIKAGADTKYSAKEAAAAQTELAKGGLDAAQILGGALNAALGLAAAGELELADAAAYTANAMNLFGLEGKDTIEIADAMAQAANSTTADVKDFGMALGAGGSVAKSAGYSFNETMVALEALAAIGIKNTDAGTSLKTSIIQLLSPSSKQAELAKKMGLEWTTNEGKMKSLAQISEMLRKKTGDMTKAQRTAAFATLAGTDGVRTLTALYDAGPSKLNKWSEELAKSGTAAEVAEKKQQNLKGQLEQLRGSVETLAIIFGSVLIPPLANMMKSLAQGVNSIGTAFDGLSKGNQHMILGFIAIAAALGPVIWLVGALTTGIGAVMGAVSGLMAIITAIRTGGAVMGAIAAAGMGPWILLGVAIAAIAVVVVTHWSQIKGAIMTAWDAVKNAFAASVTFISGVFNSIKNAVMGVVNAVTGFVRQTIPFKLFMIWLKIQIFIVTTHFKILLAVIKFAASLFIALGKALWSGLGGPIKLVASLIKGYFLSQIRFTFTLVKTLVGGLVTTFSGMWTSIKGIVKLIGALLRGDFGDAWEAVKQIFTGAGKVVVGILKGLTAPFRAAWSALGKGIKDGISKAIRGGINLIIGFINQIIGIINKLPFVEIKTISKIGTGGSGSEKGDKVGGYYRGGVIKTPTAIVGEEAPSHPEVVIPENPRYRSRALGLFAHAGKMLNVPGFAKGGIIGAAKSVAGSLNPMNLIGKLPSPKIIPDWLRGVGKTLLDGAKSYIKDKAKVFGGSEQSGGTGDGRRSGTLAIAHRIAKQAGLVVGSTYRDPVHNAAVGGVPGSLHTHGSMANPGATDLNGPVPNLYKGSRLATKYSPIENMVHDVGSGLHLHLGWFKKGGVWQPGGTMVGTSVYGGSRDPSSGTRGYKGDNLVGTSSYAELGMGNNLGGLPYLQPLWLHYHGKTVKALKRDIGAGGGNVRGHRRDLDLWHQTASALGFPFGTDLVRASAAPDPRGHKPGAKNSKGRKKLPYKKRKPKKVGRLGASMPKSVSAIDAKFEAISEQQAVYQNMQSTFDRTVEEYTRDMPDGSQILNRDGYVNTSGKFIPGITSRVSEIGELVTQQRTIRNMWNEAETVVADALADLKKVIDQIAARIKYNVMIINKIKTANEKDAKELKKSSTSSARKAQLRARIKARRADMKKFTSQNSELRSRKSELTDKWDELTGTLTTYTGSNSIPQGKFDSDGELANLGIELSDVTGTTIDLGVSGSGGGGSGNVTVVPPLDIGGEGSLSNVPVLGIPNAIGVPMLAAGAVADRAMLAVIGEAGREIVTPEDLLREIVGEGGESRGDVTVQQYFTKPPDDPYQLMRASEYAARSAFSS